MLTTTPWTAASQPRPPEERTASQRLVTLRTAAAGPPSVARREVSEPRPTETTIPLPALGTPLAGSVPDSAGFGPRPGHLNRLVERWVPGSWRGARLDPGRRGTLALLAVASAAALVAAVGVWRDRPVPEPAPPLASALGPGEQAAPSVPGSPAAGPRARGTPLVVSVAGKVRRPGLVRVPDGARVADVIASAGGPLPRVDLTGLNLARRVADGEQILVGLPLPPSGEPSGGPSGASSVGAMPAPGGKIDLNRATLEQLDTLPGVGPVTAQRILDWRTQHGRFAAIEQLREVEGIGERRFNQLRGQVTV